jgi:hypothetical protein
VENAGASAAVVITFEVPGDPARLMLGYTHTLEAARMVVDQPERLVHLCHETETGLRIVEVWTSLEAFESVYADGELRAALREARRLTGSEPPVVFQAWPLLNLMTAAAGSGAGSRSR